MSDIFRSALTVTRKKPYNDWATAQEDGPHHLEHLEADRRTVYLAPGFDDPRGAAELLDEFWEHIFEEELAAWEENDELWPTERTRELFDDWFSVEVTEAVVDLVPDQPLSEMDMETAALAYVFHHCAWCDIELEAETGRFVAFTAPNRDRFDHREGLTLDLTTGEDRILVGVVSPKESEQAAAGEDLVFRACSSRCEKLLRRQVPRALRRL